MESLNRKELKTNGQRGRHKSLYTILTNSNKFVGNLGDKGKGGRLLEAVSCGKVNTWGEASERPG